MLILRLTDGVFRVFRTFFPILSGLSSSVFCLIFHLSVGQPQKLIVELSRRQPVFLTDPQFAGLRQFSAHMAASGWELELQLQRLTRVRQALLRSARKGVTLLIFPTVYNGYDEKDLTILRAFVKKGGHLVWVTEHDNFFEHAEAANRFLMDYGVHVKDTALKKGGTNAVDAGWLNVLWTKYPEKKIKVYLPACVDVKSTQDVEIDSLLVWPPSGEFNRYVLALKIQKRGHKGCVSVLTDFEIFWNMAGTEGFSYGANRDFLTMFLTNSSQVPFSPERKMYKHKTDTKLVFQVSQEDSLILSALYSSLFRRKPWHKVRWTTQSSSYVLTTASLGADSAASPQCQYCLCGPNTRFLQAMAAHALVLEKRYPGINMAPRLKKLYEKFSLSSAPKDSAEGIPYLLTQVQVNQPEVRLAGFSQSVPYVGAVYARKISKSDIQLSAPAFTRHYGAPILPDRNALKDSSGLVKPNDVLVAGVQGKHYFNGLGLWMANQTGSLPRWVRRLRRSSWQNLKNWYSVCP